MEIPDTGRLVKKKNRYQCKIKSKIPSISGLATNAALPGVENKIPDVSSLVKKKKKEKKKKQIIIQNLRKLKGKLLIIFMTNMLLLQSLKCLQQKFSIQD